MSRAALTSHRAIPAGEALTWEAASADGNAAPAGWQSIVLVWNNSMAGITVTIPRPGTADGETLADRTVSVGANTIVSLGAMDPAIYSQADGTVYLDFSATTNVWLIFVKV